MALAVAVGVFETLVYSQRSRAGLGVRAVPLAASGKLWVCSRLNTVGPDPLGVRAAALAASRGLWVCSRLNTVGPGPLGVRAVPLVASGGLWVCSRRNTVGPGPLGVRVVPLAAFGELWVYSPLNTVGPGSLPSVAPQAFALLVSAERIFEWEASEVYSLQSRADREAPLVLAVEASALLAIAKGIYEL